jgi:hypothetical protein
VAVYLDAVVRAQNLDRQVVRAVASQAFSAQNTLSAILVALDSYRLSPISGKSVEINGPENVL